MREDQIQAIAAVNSGSSSLKFGLFSCPDPQQLLVKGVISGIGSDQGGLVKIEHVQDSTNNFKNPVAITSAEKAAELAAQWLLQISRQYKINGIGHRVVHGGSHFHEPEQIDNGFIDELKKLEPLAPLHLPDTLSVINIFKESFPDTLQVASFDTAYHRWLPFEARHYAIPRHFWEDGIVRYGFHGISCEYIHQYLQRSDERSHSKKIMVAHLGSGSSITAIKDGRSIENTMGFTPAGGMVMNTRAGDMDPGVLNYLLSEKKMSPRQLQDLFHKQSGLNAVAGFAATMEELLEKENADPKAREAVLLYCYHAKKHIGALAAILDGLDILVFTGGVGENSPVIRKRICDGLAFMGIALNDVLNERSAESISEPSSGVQVYVIPTNEEMVIAGHVKNYLNTL